VLPGRFGAARTKQQLLKDNQPIVSCRTHFNQNQKFRKHGLFFIVKFGPDLCGVLILANKHVEPDQDILRLASD
jgi:hypothetical protein